MMYVARKAVSRRQRRFAGVSFGLPILTIALGLALDVTAQFAPYTNDSHTVALWHFDGPSTDEEGLLADSSGNGHELNANGVRPVSPSANPLCKTAMDGASAGGTLVDKPGYLVSLGGETNTVTIESLLHIRSFADAAPGECRGWLGYDGGIRLGYRPDGFFEMSIGNVSQFSTAAQVTTGVWMHVAMTYDAAAGTVHIYKNGTDITGTPSPIQKGVGGKLSVFRLGKNAGNVDAHIDEVRISDAARRFSPFDPAIEPKP